jgi:hypothetical protein
MFFRQMGGTLGVAVFISILFNRLPEAIKDAMKQSDVKTGMTDAAKEYMAGVMTGKYKPTNPNVQFLKDSVTNPGSLAEKMNTDSSFLANLDPRLSRPFLMGFADSAVLVFEWAAAVVAVAFVLSWFIKVAPLRDKSAAAESAAASQAH